MQIEEYHLAGKTGDELSCEDAIVVNDRFVAVLDGATSQIANNGDELSPGKKAVNRILQEMNSLPGNIGMHECFHRLDAAIAEIYHDEGMYEKARENPEYRSSAAAMIFSRHHSELWLIGDCQALVDDTRITAWKDTEKLLAETRALFLESELAQGKTIEELREYDTGRAFIRELLVRQKRFQNRICTHAYSYFVLDGFLNDIDEAVEVHTVPPDAQRLVMGTDGYPVLKPTLKETEQVLQELITRDPLFFREHKTTKGVYSGNVSFDDRAYVSVRLDQG